MATIIRTLRPIESFGCSFPSPGTLASVPDAAAASLIAAGLAEGLESEVSDSLYTAHSILKADTAGTPAPMTIPEGTVPGRLAGGDIAALTPAQINTLTTGNSLVNTVAATGATETIPAGYEFHDVTMDEACTFTFASPAGSGHAFALRLAGAFAPTWPASVKWSSGAAPTHTTPAVYVFVTVDGGTTWLGSQMGKAFA